MTDETNEAPQPLADQSRREFLKRSAATGALIWSSPAILSLPSAGAWGVQYPEACCTADAFGLSVQILGGTPLVFDPGPGPCVATVDTGVQTVDLLGGTVRVEATTVCAEESSPAGGPCEASASIATLDITGTAVPDIHATLLTSSATATCGPNCLATGDTSIASLSVEGIVGPIDLSVCNLNLLGVVIVNEQKCAVDGTFTANALRVTVPGILEVIAAHSEAAGAQGCACVACS